MSITTNYIRLIIAEDHILVRAGLINLLTELKDVFVLGEADNGEELIDKYFILNPDIVLTDIAMPKLNGFEAAKEILKKDPDAKILFLSMFDSEEYIYKANSIGAKGLIGKNIMKGELAFAIRRVADGFKYFGNNWSSMELSELMDKYNSNKDNNNSVSTASLTDREIKILKFIADGLTSAEISECLNITKKTVDHDRAKIMSKLNIASLPSLVKFAIQYTTANDL
ncbi:MAG: response regulator transcription factor [Ignavibacteriales bacterium]|nr:response regulator transcription factor [Ignavibacteriales bacterium]